MKNDPNDLPQGRLKIDRLGTGRGRQRQLSGEADGERTPGGAATTVGTTRGIPAGTGEVTGMPKKAKKEGKTPPAPSIVYASGDDWAGLYVNGELRTENHSLRVSDVLEALGIEYERIECDQEWLEERGRLPERVEDVKGRKERPKRG